MIVVKGQYEMPAEIITENYILRETPDDPYFPLWLEEKNGEGMSMGLPDLDEILDKYFKENF